MRADKETMFLVRRVDTPPAVARILSSTMNGTVPKVLKGMYYSVLDAPTPGTVVARKEERDHKITIETDCDRSDVVLYVEVYPDDWNGLQRYHDNGMDDLRLFIQALMEQTSEENQG